MWPAVKKWIIENKYLVGIFVLATFLLFFHVGYRTLWMDETAVLQYLHQSPWEFIKHYWLVPDSHPPLYYFLVLLVSKVLPATIRLVGIAAGLGLVGMVYVFSLRITKNKQLSLIAAFFTAFSSYFILIAQMARYHSLAAFATMLMIYYFYRLYTEEFNVHTLYKYVGAFVLVGYIDYPHFIYAGLITNGLFLYRAIRHRPITSLVKWYGGQLVVAVICSPMVWFVYNRIVYQGDNGFKSTNLLGNSWSHIIAGIFFHVYSYFFGENILPWNYWIFGIGCVVLCAVIVGFIIRLRKKSLDSGNGFVILMATALIVLNTYFFNVADPRYNFIVYPKYGFVAYPFWIMTFVICLNSFRSKKITNFMYVLWLLVSIVGLVNFYQAKNYLNGSYFNTFKSFEYVRDLSVNGEYVVINGDANPGVYNFYKDTYFGRLAPIEENTLSTLEVKKRIWYFSTGSDAVGQTVSTESKIPKGFKIVRQYDSVPLDPTLKKFKEKLLHRPSYTYKYTVFLLEKE